MFKKFMAWMLIALPLCASANDSLLSKAIFDLAPVAWQMEDVAQVDRSHYQKRMLTWQTGGGQVMADEHYFAKEPVFTQQDIISSELGVNELGFLSAFVKVTPQAAIRQEKATQQALKSDRGGAHLSIVDESFSKVYGTLSLYVPIDGDEFVLSLPDPLLLSTHQNLQFVLSEYVPTDGYTLKSITRIPPPESIQHPVYVADWGINQDDIKQLAIINQGDIYGIGSDAYMLVATLKPSAIAKKDALMFDTSVGLIIHHPHKSFWHDFAPSYEYQLALPDNQIAIAMSFEPSILTSLFE